MKSKSKIRLVALVFLLFVAGDGAWRWAQSAGEGAVLRAKPLFLIERAVSAPDLLEGLASSQQPRADWDLLAVHVHDVLFGKTTPGVPVLPTVWQANTTPITILATVKTKAATRLYPLRAANAEAAVVALMSAIGTTAVDALKLDFVTNVLTDKAGRAFAKNKKNLGLYGVALAGKNQTLWLPEEILLNGVDVTSAALQNATYFKTQSYFITNDGVQPLWRGHKLWHEDLRDADFLDGLSRAIDTATHYLARAINAKGRFTYIYNPLSDDSPSSYNLIRHAGTLYALGEAYEFRQDAELVPKIQSGLAFLMKRAKPCTPSTPERWCVVEKNQVKLGANALTLLALTQYTRVTNDQQHLPVMQKLANGILALQLDSGEFWSSANLPDWQKAEHVSDYYPGEATLALTRLYQIDPDPRWLAAAERAASYLILTRDKDKTAKNITHDHWMLIALNELDRLAPKPEHLTHVEKIVTAIQNAQIQNSKWPDENGGYYQPPRSTPTAVRSEGLIAAYHLLKDRGQTALADSLLPTIKRNLLFQLRTQVDVENSLYFPNPTAALGGFQGSLVEPEIRIDYVQHNLSSLIGFYKIEAKPSF